MAKLITYLPDVLANVSDFEKICTVGDTELDRLTAKVTELYLNNFIETLTEDGCARWEKMMNICPKASDDLAVRRFRILAQLNEETPFTFRGLCDSLATICGTDGYMATLNSGEYSLSVLVALVAKNQLDEVEKLLNRIVPANIVVSLSLKYNQHITLGAFTHAFLAEYSHEQLRNEVLK